MKTLQHSQTFNLLQSGQYPNAYSDLKIKVTQPDFPFLQALLESLLK